MENINKCIPQSFSYKSHPSDCEQNLQSLDLVVVF